MYLLKLHKMSHVSAERRAVPEQSRCHEAPTSNAKSVRLDARSADANTPSVCAASASRRTDAWYAWKPVTPMAALCLARNNKVKALPHATLTPDRPAHAQSC